MTQTTKIQGESYAYSLGRSLDGAAISMNGYTLDIMIADRNCNAVLPSRRVTAKDAEGRRFSVNITALETQALDVGTYKILNKLSSNADEYTAIEEIQLNITKGCFSS